MGISRVKDLELFDSNCTLGRIISPKPGFPLSVGILLAVMDEFQTAEALVYHAMSKEFHPVDGNQVLLDEVARAGRLHAMWVLMPSGTAGFPEERAVGA